MPVSWYSLGADAHSRVLPHLPYGYVCPLCRRLFPPEARAKLTKEHVPPRHAGGRPLVLTCANCNSSAGHTVDSAASRRDALLDFEEGTGERKFRGRLGIGAEWVNVDVKTQGTDILATVLPEGEGNRPGSAQRVQEIVGSLVESGTTPDIDFTLTFSAPDQHQALLSALRSAYLVAFAVFGYSYIWRPDLAGVREQLDHPSEELLKGFSATVPGSVRNARSVAIFDEPIDYRSLVVQMGRSLVFLPHPLARDPQLYDRLRETLGNAPQPFAITGHASSFDWPTQPSHIFDFQLPATRQEGG